MSKKNPSKLSLFLHLGGVWKLIPRTVLCLRELGSQDYCFLEVFSQARRILARLHSWTVFWHPSFRDKSHYVASTWRASYLGSVSWSLQVWWSLLQYSSGKYKQKDRRSKPSSAICWVLGAILRLCQKLSLKVRITNIISCCCLILEFELRASYIEVHTFTTELYPHSVLCITLSRN